MAVAEPVAREPSESGNIRMIRAVPPPTADNPDARLAEELAAALRAVRGFVPSRIWWDEGPARALLAYQACHES